jgi:hypothetical protein
MPTRKPKAAPTSARVHRGLAAALVFVVLGGCAQVLGLEEWEPVDCEEDPEDPACEEPVSCSECLFGVQATCQGDRMACNAEMMGCSSILKCAPMMCSGNADPVECIRTSCCPMGNNLFDMYLTCMCDACADACGSLTVGCANACNLPL